MGKPEGSDFRTQATELSSRWIRRACDLAGISQSELARRTGISSCYLSRTMSCRQTAGMELIVRVMDACGLEVIELRVRKKGSHVEKKPQNPAAA